jgi:copper chaperone NosL
MRGLMTWPALVLLLLACGTSEGQDRVRCALCGMTVDASSGWRAGARASNGDALSFDTPKCLFRYRDERGAMREPWVIEYYSQARRSADDLFFVIGADVQGPMGRDLVPIAGRENAERFAHDHGGRVLAHDEVTREVVSSLFAPRS